MARQPYTPPVSQLLLRGEADMTDPDEWPDYAAELGLTAEHIPELIRLATDDELQLETDLDDPASWAAIHAARVLGQLRAEAAIEPLLATFAWDSDWAGEEVPEVYAMIGPAAIPALAGYLATEHDDEYGAIHAATSLTLIAEHFPDARDQAMAPIISRLECYEKNTPAQNGFFIADLVDLKVVEAAPLMKRAFAANAVDDTVMGDWDDVQYELGLSSEPPSKQHLFLEEPDWKARMADPAPAPRPPTKNNPTKKAKAKMAKASRKQNRKRSKHK